MNSSSIKTAGSSDLIYGFAALVLIMLGLIVWWGALDLPGVTGPEMIEEAKIATAAFGTMTITMGLFITNTIRARPWAATVVGLVIIGSKIAGMAYSLKAYAIING